MVDVCSAKKVHHMHNGDFVLHSVMTIVASYQYLYLGGKAHILAGLLMNVIKKWSQFYCPENVQQLIHDPEDICCVLHLAHSRAFTANENSWIDCGES
jgi:hypothetical protein